MTSVHFHAGPMAGMTLDLVDPTAEVIVSRVVEDAEGKPLHTEEHRYVTDSGSAGGRCYDWAGKA